jgi:hypothetical protein
MKPHEAHDLFIETALEVLCGMSAKEILSMDGVLDVIIKNMTVEQKKAIIDCIRA